MKVFLSWSGDQSHKVALVFKEWFPSVIQSLVPYVSSEDIDKGARWSTDIATELENSTFGILCVTKENFNAPWLTFEAGALSKTIDNSSVCPFLFNIKRSEIEGPILQFQSTIFEKDDIKKLLNTLNNACDEGKLSDKNLDKAFEVWYPTLEKELNEIKGEDEIKESKNQKNKDSSNNEILEEILELSRLNQKLLRNPDIRLPKEIEQMILNREENYSRMKRRKHYPMLIEELFHFSSRFQHNYTGLQISLSLFRNDFPWIYEAGMELVQIFRSKKSNEEKEKAVGIFMELMEFTFEHPLMRDTYGTDKELYMMGRELRRIIMMSLKNKEQLAIFE